MWRGYQMKKQFIVVAILIGGYFFWQQNFSDIQIKSLVKDGFQKVCSVSNISNKTNKIVSSASNASEIINERVYSASNISSKTNKKKQDFSNLTLHKKMRIAEKNWKEYEKNVNSLLKKMAREKLTPEKVMKYNSRFSNFGQDEAMKFNCLGMPCPITFDKQSYSAWSNKYRQKRRKFMDNMIVQRNKLTSKVEDYGAVSM